MEIEHQYGFSFQAGEWVESLDLSFHPSVAFQALLSFGGLAFCVF